MTTPAQLRSDRKDLFAARKIDGRSPPPEVCERIEAALEEYAGLPERVAALEAKVEAMTETFEWIRRTRR